MDRDSIMVTLLTVITVFAVLIKLRLRKKKQPSLLHDDDVLQMTRGPVPNIQDMHLRCSGLLPRDVLNDRSRIHDPNLIIDSLDWILSRRFGSKVHSLDLLCCLSKCVASRFEETVICSVERLRVENFVLVCNCYSHTSHDLPFSCHFLSEMHSLKYFQLRLCSLHPSWRSQRNYSLQTLYLSEVTVSSGAVECVLSTCSMLHTLRIVNCKCPSKLRIRGIDLELKTLDVSACEDLEEIDFFAGNLVRFDFFNNRETVNIVFNHVPKLECILLKLGPNLEGSIIERRVLGKIEEDLPHLKSLIIVIIEGDSLEV
ncbi:PREDICTED: uncharacterized protein LOC105974300 [Erythranthe guttata]|uniref:uncharacterized protein LOC105974300 n=1 Tax=Erythranthe guttata TaxID=4155 RepID=UPI00064DCE08|nr:PREDICTED: uncharacterized protein LOC105974300 [Erythranthe guttata]|eukprot:XP_012854821.1 PREDICTED: uncharacterized protein LOC105974300 [Erythranthe guttata]